MNELAQINAVLNQVSDEAVQHHIGTRYLAESREIGHEQALYHAQFRADSFNHNYH